MFFIDALLLVVILNFMQLFRRAVNVLSSSEVLLHQAMCVEYCCDILGAVRAVWVLRYDGCNTVSFHILMYLFALGKFF